MKRFANLAVMMVLGALALTATAQTYPTRPVRVIIAFPPGSATDIIGRVITAKVSEIWAQQAVPDNRGGAGGSIASLLAARAAPDGYTLLINKPVPGTSMWSPMWDEVLVASLIDPTVIKKSETLWLDVDFTRGPKYGHTVIWKKPHGELQFFLPYSGPKGVDPEKWRGHLNPPAHLHPATVHMGVDVAKFERIFVDLMSR